MLGKLPHALQNSIALARAIFEEERKHQYIGNLDGFFLAAAKRILKAHPVSI